MGFSQGQKTGINNQNKPLHEFVSNFSVWAFSSTAKQQPRCQHRGYEFFCLISPKKSFVEIVDKLKEFIPESIEDGKNIATMHKLVYKKRKNMYGWRIVKTLTCSEAVKGIQDSISDLNLNNDSLHLEEDLLINEDLE